MRTLVAGLCLLAVLAVAAPALAAPPSPRADRALERALDRLVEADGGPPGAVSVVQIFRSAPDVPRPAVARP